MFEGGFIYLCAVIDWYSRAVLAWELSNTLDATFCVQTVQRAIALHGPPEILTATKAVSLLPQNLPNRYSLWA